MPRRSSNLAAVDHTDAATLAWPAPDPATLWRPAGGADAAVDIDDEVAAATLVNREATIVWAHEATVVKTPLGAAPPPATGSERGDTASPLRYVVVGTAGQGGMGTVHVARDVDLLRNVALKELSQDGAHDRGARTRFVREVQVTAQLDHPHIVPVYSLEVAAGGRPAYAMKLVEGQTFRQLVDDARTRYAGGQPASDELSLAARLEHFLKVCDAVDYAHARGVVHRDLKPANLMLGRHNEVYVMDWGICRLLTHHEGLTAEAAVAPGAGGDANATALGTLIGTPMYMSPEQAQGRHADLDARSDLCALGLILFELVTLQRPFSATKVDQVIQQASTGERSAIVHAWREAIPSELTAIIERATAFEPAKRYGSVGALAEDLRRFLRGDAVEARPDSAWEKLVRRLARRRQAVAVAVLVFAMVSVSAVAGLLWRHERTLERLRTRERYMQAFVNDVAQIGDRLQTEVLEVRGELGAMTASVAQSSLHGRNGDRASLPPADPSTRGQFVVLPGASPDDAALLIERLRHMSAVQRRILTRVRRALGARDNRSATTADVTGLHRLVVGLDAGVGYVFPAGALGAVGDLRNEEWYRATKAGSDIEARTLGGPGDREHELSISRAVRNDDNAPIGAVSLVVSLDNVLTNLLADTRTSRVHGTWILAQDGRVLAAHADSPEQAAALVRQLPLQELLRAVKRRDIGFIETTAFGAPQIVAFDRIHPLEWTLLQLVSESDLAARPLRD
jgi:serine/threonine-protein kinase